MVAPDLLSLFVRYGLNVVGAIVILIIGWLIAGWAAKLVRHYGERSERFDETVVLVLVRLVRLAILAFTIIAVLHRFGVQAASIVAVLGAAGLAVGLALQGPLSNVAAGVMILVLRPFKVGQAVDINGTSGTVEDIDLFMTRLLSFDGVPTYLPNGQVWGNVIKNFSQSTTRRVDLILGIGYEDDIDKSCKSL